MDWMIKSLRCIGGIIVVIASLAGCGGGGSGGGGGGDSVGGTSGGSNSGGTNGDGSSNGGGGSTPVATADFNIMASGVVSVIQGTTSSPITVTVDALNGLHSNVSVAISDLPAGATTNPTFPLTVSSGTTQQFTVTVPASAPVGSSTISLDGDNGSIEHSTSLTLNTTAAVQTFQSEGILYLQSIANGHTARIGLNPAWGGAIVEVSIDGVNFVNAHDVGREVQPAFYDGAANYTATSWGWDPVLGGDRYNHGSPVLPSVSTNSIYVKTQPLEWNPDDKGGGPNTPVLSDTIVEQTVTVDPSAPLAFKIHFVITHAGADQHYNAQQELPAVYVNSEYGNFHYYGGTNPWTNAALTHLASLPTDPGTGTLYSTEQWSALTDADGQGLTLFTPNQYPYVMANLNPGEGGGPTGNRTFYMRPFTLFTFGPGAVLQEDIYLIPGDVEAVRAAVYNLHQKLAPVDIFSPTGSIDTPATNATISGTNVTFSGWAFGNVPVSTVEILIDGVVRATPSLNVNRPDVVAIYPHVAPLQCGWSFNIDSRYLTNGIHSIVERITDSSGNVALIAPVKVTVSN